MYLVDEQNMFEKVAVGKITGRPGMECPPNALIEDGWYQVRVIEVYQPQTSLQWPDESNALFKLSQVANMKTLWGEDYIVPRQ